MSGNGKIGRKARISKFSRALVLGKSQREAAIIAGYAPSCADARASELVRLPEVRIEISHLLDAAGLDDKRIAQEIANGIRQTRFRRYQRLELLKLLIKLRGLDRSVEPAPAIDGKENALAFCRAYWAAKQEHENLQGEKNGKKANER